MRPVFHVFVCFFFLTAILIFHASDSYAENHSLSSPTVNSDMIVLSDPAPPSFPLKLLGNKVNSNTVENSNGFVLVSDPDTRIEGVFIQTQNPDDPFLFDLVEFMRKDIKFIVLLRDKNYAAEIWKKLRDKEIPNLKERLRFILNEKKRIKKWSRDPYVVLCNPKDRLYTLIPAYSSHDTGPKWVSDAILETDVGFPSLVKNDFKRIATWAVEGGGIAADDLYAYVGHDTIYYSRRRGEQSPRYTRDEAIDSIEDITGKKVIVLPAADLHADRYHIPVGKTAYGERTSLLADPIALFEIIRSLNRDEKEAAIKSIQSYGAAYKSQKFFKTPAGVDEMIWLESFLDRSDLWDFLNTTDEQLEEFKKSPYIQQLEEAAKVLAHNGITVVRIPALSHSYEYEDWERAGGKLELTIKKHFFPLGFYYTNIIQDKYKGERSVVIPKYGIKKLDAAVKKKFESLKAFDKIHQIRCVIEGTQGGGPRCRVQVLGFPD